MIEEPTITWIEATKKASKSIQRKYARNGGMLLTEGDLECYLFNELMKQPELKGFYPSKKTDISTFENSLDDSNKTSYVHSQVTWFKVNEKSGFEPDLTIAEPNLLEIENRDTLLDWPSKGFAYDGPCVAVELKFLRNTKRASMQAHEDLNKFIDDLRPSVYQNINEGNYKLSNPNNVAFISLVGCKDEEVYRLATKKLKEHLIKRANEIGENIIIGLFYQKEIVWFDKNSISEGKKIKRRKRPTRY